MIKNQPNAKRVNILGVKVDPLSIESANNNIRFLIEHYQGQTAYVVKPYVEFVVAADNNPALQNIINNADLVLADGVSLQWAASYLFGAPKNKFAKLIRSGLFWIRKPDWINQIIPAKMAGVNQTWPLFELAQKQQWRVGIIGGPTDSTSLKKSINNKFPSLKHLFVWNGWFESHQEQEIIDSIHSVKLDILFVAMGFPLQEKFIDRNLNNKLAKIMIGEGGTFDYDQFGGKHKRAPQWMQNWGIEWLWRLMIQPQRIIRQLAIPKFVLAVYRQSRKTD